MVTPVLSSDFFTRAMFKFLKRNKVANSINKIQERFAKEISEIAMQIKKGKRNEENMRVWLIDLLKSTLGYSRHDIETEYTVLGQKHPL